MPSPIGHALGGLIVHAATRDRTAPFVGPRALLLAALAMAPDLDLALRFLDGVNHHRGASHSIGAAVVCGLTVAAALRWRVRPEAPALGRAAAFAWASHVALDLLGSDTNPPLGIMALWPFSPAYLKAPFVLFLDIGRTLSLATVRENALAAAWEVVVLLPILLAVVGLRSGGAGSDGSGLRKQSGR